MSFTLGEKLKISVSGASHSEAIGVVVEGLPKGEAVDLEKVGAFLKRRQGGNASYTTARKEKDEPVIEGGLEGGVLTGEPLVAKFINANAKSGDYAKMRTIPRPSHADYVAYVKYKGQMDMSGGGFFSGRMTLPMCFAGAVCMQLLEKRGISISAHIRSVGDIDDKPFDPVSDDVETLADHATVTRDTDVLTEYVRQSLKRAISAKYFAANEATSVVTLDPKIEQEIMNSVKQTEQGAYLTLDPDRTKDIMNSVGEEVAKLENLGRNPIVITSPIVRMYFKKLTEDYYPDLIVVSYNEIDSNVELQSVGMVTA